MSKSTRLTAYELGLLAESAEYALKVLRANPDKYQGVFELDPERDDLLKEQRFYTEELQRLLSKMAEAEAFGCDWLLVQAD